ncbi:response regulator [Dyella koreensis]|uniref:Response regulator transcription factor n=1 Tax=Dyella koreensis TaxID=311235 RepID=A0ABW8K8I1_9GAMM
MIPRIVLAGDQPVALIGIAEAIARSGVGLVTGQAASMDELQDILQTGWCDLIVTDFRMPERDRTGGLALLQDIRTAYPKIPLAVMTGMDNPAIHHAVLSMGVKALISKSDRLNEIPQAIKEVMLGSTYLSTTVLLAIVQGGLPLDFQQPRLSCLGREECRIVSALAAGSSVEDIASKLGVSTAIVFWRKHAVMRKLGARSDRELFAYLDELAGLPGEWFVDEEPMPELA